MGNRRRARDNAVVVSSVVLLVMGAMFVHACGTTSQAPVDESAGSAAQRDQARTTATADVQRAQPMQTPEVVASPPQQTHPRVCPPESEWPQGMACVLGGTFMLGNAEGRPDEREPGEVYVDTMYMDLTEVTNEAYEVCIQSGACTRPMPFRRFMTPRQPLVAVSWFDAVHHCEMLGKRLPTEAEWEHAAGGPDHTTYSWGNEPLGCERASLKDARGEGCGSLITPPVGSYPAGHYGLFDMTGSLHEWVQDFYSPCLRGCDHECGDACFGDNPKGPCGGAIGRCPGYGLRSVRGGSWFWPEERARVTARRGSGAPNRGPHRFGFRCARDLVVSTPPAAVAPPAAAVPTE